MGYSTYVGHPSQLCCVEEVRLIGGKGDGMRLLQVRNGAGLEMTISADRCADISRLIYKGDNVGFFSPCGYVSACYYDGYKNGFLKSFTGGFLTTCGLQNVGSSCSDNGEMLPMHGTIGNTPCERIWWEETENDILIHAMIPDRCIFAKKLLLQRTIICSKTDSFFTISDVIENQGNERSPVMLMYHMNIGYPMLSERAIVNINSDKVLARNEHAEKDIGNWMHMLQPISGFEEQCYYHRFTGKGLASVFNPDIGKKIEVHFDSDQLWNFTEWKMMGVHDYVLGLEPGNCTPDGRAAMRECGRIQYLEPGESVEFSITVKLSSAYYFSNG